MVSRSARYVVVHATQTLRNSNVCLQTILPQHHRGLIIVLEKTVQASKRGEFVHKAKLFHPLPRCPQLLYGRQAVPNETDYVCMSEWSQYIYFSLNGLQENIWCFFTLICYQWWCHYSFPIDFLDCNFSPPHQEIIWDLRRRNQKPLPLLSWSHLSIYWSVVLVTGACHDDKTKNPKEAMAPYILAKWSMFWDSVFPNPNGENIDL